METFSTLLILCAGNSPVTGEFPAQRPVTRSFDVFFDNDWVNNREAGDLRRHRARYDVPVMVQIHQHIGAETNGCHFAEDILNAFSSMKILPLELKFNLFLSQHWFR